MKKILYKILKKDMIKKLREKHGSQFVDDVMDTFGIPTNLLKDELNIKDNLVKQEDWWLGQ